jgi:hypothetical protein
MKFSFLPALAVALALPVAAQGVAPNVESRTPPVGTSASPKTTEKAATPRESARAAKAQNKDLRCATREKQPRQKKPTAT